MKLRIINKNDREIEIEIEGEKHTFCNVLRKILVENEHVEMAGYKIPHPLSPKSIFYVRTKNNYSPDKVLKDAAKNLKLKTNKFKKYFEKELIE